MKRVFEKDKYKVEPGNVHHIQSIISFNIANVERTLADPPCNCTAEDIPDTYVTQKGMALTTYKDKNVYEYARDITGNVTLAPGFNCGIIKISSNNELQLIASKGMGASISEPQVEYELYEGELENKPENASSMTGGISCATTIKAINGTNNPHIVFNAGAGIDITVEDNIVYLDVNERMLNGECENGCENTK